MGRIGNHLSPARRLATIATAACFFLTSVAGQGIAAAAEGAGVAPESRATGGFSVPYPAGRITGGRYTGSSTVVVAIQDLHCHAEVQRNIAKILAHLDARYRLRNVYVEGGMGDIDTGWVKLIDDEKLRGKIVESLLESGRLTGPEYYSITSGKHDLLTGLEDEKIYTENLVRLSEILAASREVQGVLPAIRDGIDGLKQRYYRPKNRNLEKAVAGNRNGSLDTTKYYRLLLKLARETAVDAREYANIESFLSLADTEKRLDYRRIARQLRRYILALKGKLPYGTYRVLIEKTRDFSQLEELYLYLGSLSREYRIDAEGSFAELNGFFRFIEAQQRINPAALIGEERQLVKELRLRLAESESEREVAFLGDFYAYLDDYLKNKISPEDYGYYLQGSPRFRKLWMKYVGTERLKTLEPYTRLLDAFYLANIERNSCFVNRILGASPVIKTPAIRLVPDENQRRKAVESLGDAKEIIPVVTGGFHTPGLTDFLDDRNISYIVVTPNVGTDAGYAEKIYRELARQKVVLFASQTMGLPYFSDEMAALTGTAALRAIRDAYIESELARRLRLAGASPEKIAAGMNDDLEGILTAELDYDGGIPRFTVTQKDGRENRYRYENGELRPEAGPVKGGARPGPVEILKERSFASVRGFFGHGAPRWLIVPAALLVGAAGGFAAVIAGDLSFNPAAVPENALKFLANQTVGRIVQDELFVYSPMLTTADEREEILEAAAAATNGVRGRIGVRLAAAFTLIGAAAAAGYFIATGMVNLNPAAYDGTAAFLSTAGQYALIAGAAGVLTGISVRLIVKISAWSYESVLYPRSRYLRLLMEKDAAARDKGIARLLAYRERGKTLALLLGWFDNDIYFGRELTDEEVSRLLRGLGASQEQIVHVYEHMLKRVVKANIIERKPQHGHPLFIIDATPGSEHFRKIQKAFEREHTLLIEEHNRRRARETARDPDEEPATGQALKKKELEGKDALVVADYQKAIAEGRAISIYGDWDAEEIERLFERKEAARLAEMLTRKNSALDSEKDRNKRKDFMRKYLTLFMDTPHLRRDLRRGLTGILEITQHPAQRSLEINNRRFVILLSNKGPFAEGKVLAYANQNTIYLHVRLLKFASPMVLKAIIEHENRDLAAGSHAPDIPEIEWKEVKRFWNYYIDYAKKIEVLQAAETAARRGERSGLDTLVGALNTPSDGFGFDLEIRRLARSHLGFLKLKDDVLFDAYAEAFRWSTLMHHRMFAIESMVRLGDKRAGEYLQEEFLRVNDILVRTQYSHAALVYADHAVRVLEQMSRLEHKLSSLPVVTHELRALLAKMNGAAARHRIVIPADSHELHFTGRDISLENLRERLDELDDAVTRNPTYVAESHFDALRSAGAALGIGDDENVASPQDASADKAGRRLEVTEERRLDESGKVMFPRKAVVKPGDRILPQKFVVHLRYMPREAGYHLGMKEGYYIAIQAYSKEDTADKNYVYATGDVYVGANRERANELFDYYAYLNGVSGWWHPVLNRNQELGTLLQPEQSNAYNWRTLRKESSTFGAVKIIMRAESMRLRDERRDKSGDITMARNAGGITLRDRIHLWRKNSGKSYAHLLRQLERALAAHPGPHLANFQFDDYDDRATMELIIFDILQDGRLAANNPFPHLRTKDEVRAITDHVKGLALREGNKTPDPSRDALRAASLRDILVGQTLARRLALQQAGTPPLPLASVLNANGKSYAIISSRYDERTVERAANLAARGMNVILVMPDPGFPVEGAIPLSGRSLPGAKGLPRALLGSGYADVWARSVETENGTLHVFFHKPSEGLPSIDERLAGTAVLQLLADTPALAGFLGMKPLNIGVIEADNPLSHPALTGADRSFSDEVVFALRDGGTAVQKVPEEPSGRRSELTSLTGDIEAARIRALFDIFLEEGETAPAASAVSASIKRKASPGYLRGEPVVSLTFNLDRSSKGLKGLNDAVYLLSLKAQKVDTIVLSRLTPERWINGKKEIAGIVAKAHLLGIRVVFDYGLPGTGEAALRAAASEIEQRLREDSIPFDGFRIDASGMPFDDGAGATLTPWLKELKRTSDRINPDMIAGFILPDGVEWEANGGAYVRETLNFRRVVRFLPGEQPEASRLPKGAWLEMSLTKGAADFVSEFKDAQVFTGTLDRLFATGEIGVFGFDAELIDEGRKLLVAEHRDFAGYFREQADKVLGRLARDPAYRFKKERSDALALDAKDIPELADEAKAGAVQALEEYFSSREPGRLPARLAALLDDSHLRDLAALAVKDPEAKTLYAEASSGYASGLLERQELRLHYSENRPFIIETDREIYGWALLRARLLALGLGGITLPFEKAKNGTPYYETLKEIIGEPAPDPDGDIKYARAAVARIEEQVYRKATLSGIQPQVREAVSILRSIAAKNDPATYPFAITELLRVLDLYAREGKGILEQTGDKALEALPAAIRHILGAA